MNETNVVALTEGLLALTNTAAPIRGDASELRPIFEKLIALMKQTTLPADQKIRVLRAFEMAATERPERRRSGDQEDGPRRADAQFPATPPAGNVSGLLEPDRA